jgi:hypothetical protein
MKAWVTELYRTKFLVNLFFFGRELTLKWRGRIDQVAGKMRRLLGVLGRARADLDRRLLISLYNSMVLPHLQYCLKVWGNFETDRNKAQGEILLKLQKRFIGIIVGKGGRYHADPLFSKYGILKAEDACLEVTQQPAS